MKKVSVVLVLFLASVAIMAFFSPVPAKKQQLIIVDTLAKGLTVPWGISFLPAGQMMFTERDGNVRLLKDNKANALTILKVAGIEVRGKMGLLGLCLHPAFKTNHFVYLAYNYRKENSTFLRVERYEYQDDKLLNPLTIVEGIPGVFNHTGSRLKFGPDGKLYITTGDADAPVIAQSLKILAGKILRLNDDGSIPVDNPFVNNDTARHEIWSYGHRNPQGIAFQPGTGLLYSSEHGPTGGDEINLIYKGGNYGWPVIHHREQHTGMVSPLLEFTPSIGPSETLFYSGKAFTGLKGHLLTACMRGEAILNMTIGQGRVTAYNFLLKNKYGRIRALTEGPDGYLYFSTSQVDPPESKLQSGENGFDMILRLRPAENNESAWAIPLEMEGSLKDALNRTLKPVVKKDKTKNIEALYVQLCAGCHGANLEGRDNVPSLVDNAWINGGTKSAIQKSIGEGIVSRGMPAWRGVLSNDELDKLADFILAKKINR